MAEQKATKGRRMALARVQEEVSQGQETRKGLYQQLEAQLPGKKVVAFFTSFVWPVVLQDGDADMLEEILRNTLDDSNQLVLILNCPGGDALAAERVISVCRSYSKDGFIVIVPKMAKSAATMICLGANEIWMSPTSELGPIDPQIPVWNDSGTSVKYLAAHEIIESYNDLVKAANETKGRIEPYLQQLARYDSRDIRRIVSAQKLSESIAVRSLQSGYMKGKTESQIKKKIKPLLEPTYAKVHGRPFYPDLATKCGLPVKLQDIRSEIWQDVWELYVRLNTIVGNPSFSSSKVVESATDSFIAPAPARAGRGN